VEKIVRITEHRILDVPSIEKSVRRREGEKAKICRNQIDSKNSLKLAEERRKKDKRSNGKWDQSESASRSTRE